MMEHSQIVAAIIEAIRETGSLMPGVEMDNLSESTIIAGPGGFVDSIGLTMLALEIEEQLNAQLPKPISINDDRTLALQPSPFRTTGALAEYIQSQLSS